MIILICDDDKNCLSNEEKYIRDNTEAVPECFLGGKELLKRLSAGTEDIAAVYGY
jgi:two-component system LytT family response regulator